jgi:hypothetical protein
MTTTFLVRGEANLIGAIVLGLEVVIILPRAIENYREQFSGLPIAATECLLCIEWINLVEVVLVQAQVARRWHAASATSTPARWYQEMLVNHVDSGNQKIGLVVGSSLDNDSSTFS